MNHLNISPNSWQTKNYQPIDTTHTTRTTYAEIPVYILLMRGITACLRSISFSRLFGCWTILLLFAFHMLYTRCCFCLWSRSSVVSQQSLSLLYDKIILNTLNVLYTHLYTERNSHTPTLRNLWTNSEIAFRAHVSDIWIVFSGGRIVHSANENERWDNSADV